MYLYDISFSLYSSVFLFVSASSLACLSMPSSSPKVVGQSTMGRKSSFTCAWPGVHADAEAKVARVAVTPAGVVVVGVVGGGGGGGGARVYPGG